MLPPRSRNNQVSSEWKRAEPRRGDPDPGWRTIIQARPLRSSLATKTLKPACALAAPRVVAHEAECRLPVRAKYLNARGFEPCAWPKAQPYQGSRGGCQVAHFRGPPLDGILVVHHSAQIGEPSGAGGCEWSTWSAARAAGVPRSRASMRSGRSRTQAATPASVILRSAACSMIETTARP